MTLLTMSKTNSLVPTASSADLPSSQTLELRAEGLAREVVRRVQTMRKEAGLQLDDRIITTFETDAQLAAVVTARADYIQAETLSDDLVAGPPAEGAHSEHHQVEGHPLTLGVALAQS